MKNGETETKEYYRPASTRSITPLSYRIIPETCLPIHNMTG